MKAGPTQPGASGSHAHSSHAHGPQAHTPHAHSHEPGHHHGTHTHAAAPAQAGEPRPSLLMSSAPWRLAGAVALIAVLWAAVAWALSGTP
jgi:hypothetical protein